MTRDLGAVLHYAADGPVYRAGRAPVHLGTRRQLRVDGLSVAGLIPAGWLHYSPLHGICPLYDRRQARPVRALTDRQRAALALGRELANTCECGRCRATRVPWYPAWAGERRPLCDTCRPVVEAEERAARERQRQEAAERFRQRLAADREAAARWAGEVLADPSAVVLDTETTGLYDAWVVDLAILASDGTVLLDTLVNPLEPIPADATAIHGITDSMVSDAPTFADLLPRLESLLTGRRVVIYNAAFDAGIVQAELRRVWYGDRPPLIWELGERWRGWAGGAGAAAECAMHQHARWVGDWDHYHQSYTWQPLCGGHRAAADCRAVLDRLRTMAAGQLPLFVA